MILKTYAKALTKSKFFLKPLVLSIPVASAYVPLGMILGVLWVSNGIHPIWAPLTALMVFAGSMEFLVIGFICRHLAFCCCLAHITR